MKIIFLLSFLISSLLGFSQRYESDIAAINSRESAEAYAELHGDVSIIFLHDNLENSTYLEMKDTLKVGDSFKMQFYRLRVVELGEKELYRCSYIFMDSKNQIDGKVQRDQDEILKKLKSGDSFPSLHAKYSMDKNENNGDLGWIDPDHMAPGFRDGILTHKYGDIFKCSDDTLGWYYVVKITEKTKKIKGHYVLVYPEMGPLGISETIDHEANLKLLSTDEEIKEYALNNESVDIHLFNEVNDPQFFKNLVQFENTGAPIIGNKFDVDGMRYVVLKDTTVKLYSFQYIFIDGSKISEDERKGKVNDIYNRYNGGESFDSLISDYWSENKEYSTLENFEGTLLMDELVTQLDLKKPGEIFVARKSQSYYIGVPLEKVKVVEAYFAISYPIMIK